METSHMLQLLPTADILTEELILQGIPCTSFISAPNIKYHGVRLFTGNSSLQSDILYILREEQQSFSVDQYSFISTVPINGSANHLYCPQATSDFLLDVLLDIFSHFHKQELLLEQMTYRCKDLNELCQLSSELFNNPVCIHDNWFIITGMSIGVKEIMPPEHILSSTVGYVPSMVLEDFKFDEDYLNTYAYPNAQLWLSETGVRETLYVNLWDGTIYRGRLLIFSHNRAFRKLDFLLADFLAQRAVILLKKAQPGDLRQSRRMDDIVFELLSGASPDPSDLTHLLDMLNWKKNDSYICIRLKSQQPRVATIMEHMLHSDLFQIFGGSYIMFTEHEQCIIINTSCPDYSREQLRYLLAPLCRDYCLYAGISSPINGIRDLHSAYFQAMVALDTAFQMHSDKWIVEFSQCALSHIFSHLPSPLLSSQIVSPDIRFLIQYDQANDTQYFETLRAYLLNERDITKASNSLIIHRTTLQYRLKKIQTLIHVDLEDPWNRLYLLLSLWILEKEEAK